MEFVARGLVDLGKEHKMRISAKASIGGASVLALAAAVTLTVVGSGSAGTSDVQPPGNIAVPAITGLQVGQTLTVTSGTWAGATPMSFQYTWLRSGGTGGWTAIPGAGTGTYTLTDAGGVQWANAATTSQVTGATAADTIALPNGQTSVLIDHVTLPNRLVVQSVTFSPSSLKPGGKTIAQVLVQDAFGHPVRGALVQIVGLPFGAIAPAPEVATGTDGTASITLTASSQLASAGGAIALQVRARKSGENVLTGVTGTRLVKLSVG
jgi:hypothetical protein